MTSVSVESSVANGRMPIVYPIIEGSGSFLTDEELVEKSLRGEEDAFRCLYERYRRPVYAVVCRIVLDPEEARDATQEIFITVYRSLALWSPQRARLLPWIYRIATNRAIDYWRIRRRRAELPLADASEKQSSRALLCWRGVRPMERTLEHKERVAEMLRFLTELPRPQRRFFILRYYSGLKLKEIARKEGYKLGTVKSSLHRATMIMRRKLRRTQ